MALNSPYVSGNGGGDGNSSSSSWNLIKPVSCKQLHISLLLSLHHRLNYRGVVIGKSRTRYLYRLLSAAPHPSVLRWGPVKYVK